MEIPKLNATTLAIDCCRDNGPNTENHQNQTLKKKKKKAAPFTSLNSIGLLGDRFGNICFIHIKNDQILPLSPPIDQVCQIELQTHRK